ncbi:acyl-CoA/acyl-ACP dehydrogenase [Streptomyces sp. NBC_01142]|uniref:acyl-CoA dehydrogenase family protein n=1 Tax=Streptomyces sp. NBC_01142 TaxID=2975865 RepID=UPI00224C810E|nr:acyl-CoA dehydrogenase family protein [Streptomyces sp. NBC_01142]MCX4823854.1 acyl-CoA/acyl-ACP dehydrogenase [Streptomyces sp. NBC_01142]
MDFRLTDEQRALRNGVRELLAGRFGRDALRAAVGREGTVDRALWRELGEAGFFSLRVPEADGGVGLGLPEAVLAFEEAGRALLNGPLVATHLAATGGVPGAADGGRVVTCDTQLPGFIPHFADADVSVALHGASMEGRSTDGRSLQARPLQARSMRVRYPKDLPTARPARSMDPLTPLHRIPGAARTAPPRPDAVLLTAAEQLGSAARTTEMAVQYAKEREQFGRPIGGFQAVKHLCAQMLVRTEVSRSAVYAAAVTEDFTEIAGAKLLADEAAVRNARDCLQVYGGMGFTWEADVHLHLKRAWLRGAMWLTASEAEEIQAEALASAL